MYKFLVVAAAIVDAKGFKARISDTTSPSSTCSFYFGTSENSYNK